MSESNITKKAIADGFKLLMTKKPFEKITISDITSECGLNRQTFYYHFRDKYELLNWVFYNEAITPLAENLTFDNWNQKLLQLLTTIKNNSKFYTNALRTSYGVEFRQYMMKIATDVFIEAIDNISKQLDEKDKIFIAEFFAYGVVGTMTEWITKGMRATPETIVTHLENMVYDCQKLAVSRYIKERKN